MAIKRQTVTLTVVACSKGTTEGAAESEYSSIEGVSRVATSTPVCLPLSCFQAEVLVQAMV